MKRWLSVTLCLIAVAHLVGGHWGLLQVVAWAQMLKAYSEEKGFGQAVVETFDGEHPCPLCLKIQEGREQEAPGKPLSRLKWDGPTAWLAVFGVAMPPGVGGESPVSTGFAPDRALASQWAAMPPTPPPRA